MILDINNRIGVRRGKPEISAQDLIKAMDKANVDMSVVFCFSEAMDNDYVKRAVKAHKDRLIGLYTANPWEIDAADKLKRGLEDGFKGLRLDAVRHGFAMNDAELLAELFETCRSYRVPVWAYGAAEVLCAPILFQEMAGSFPDVPLIIGYMGFNYEASSACDVAARCGNVFLDTAGSMAINMKKAVSVAGPDKILMGTGTPDTGYFELEIQKVRESTNNLDHQKMIMGGNAARLFGLKPEDGGVEN